MPQLPDRENFFSSEEFNNMSKPLQEYTRAVFGIISVSRQAEEELWNRLNPDEQRQATDIARRMVAHAPKQDS
jgi:hypothetical protein